MLGHSFVDGEIVRTSEARVPIDDLGLLRCYSIYEGITTVGTTPVFLTEHVDRLENSARILGLRPRYSWEEIEKIITNLAQYVKAPRGDIRVVLTGGRSADGITPSSKSLLYAIVNDMTPLPRAAYTEGIKVMTHEYQRVMPECKTTHYTMAAMLQGKKKDVGAIEILYTSTGNVLEAATCNVFIVKNGIIATPERNILHGITRMKTLQLLDGEGTEVKRREVSVEELLAADEVFLTSSYKDILPVTLIDDRKVADGKVGELTKTLMKGYQSLLETLK